MTKILSDRELQTLRNWGNLAEEADAARLTPTQPKDE